MTTEIPKKKNLLIEEDLPPGFTRIPIVSTSGSESVSENVSGEKSSSELEYDDTELETDFDKVKDKCDTNRYSSDCNKFMLKKELVERNSLKKEDDKPYLYPNLNDPNFNIKIAEKKEFNDTKYDGEIHKSIKEHADELANADFELSPHQAFVKNFLSSQTPYNSLLLYHGLGSGKTCSAIGVSEEMRDYLKQMGMSRRIIIVASENVQDNFKLQLFDERKLKLVDGLWNIKACIGNKLLKEINPMNMKGIPREKVVSQIKALINNSYLFLGYGQFANYIIKTMHYDEEEEYEKPKFKKGEKKKPKEKNKIQMLQDIEISLNKETIKRIQNEFDNRLIIIDEVHNIRKTDDNENKKVAIFLEYLVKAAQNVRLLFLSATPMYNSYKEIIWLLNIMNMNDKRAKIETKNVFDANGNFKEKGEELLIRKATGYISFVRGENPYTFPYKVYPDEFAKENTFPLPIQEDKSEGKDDEDEDKVGKKYPIYQMNKKKIKKGDTNRIISLFLNTIGGCDSCGVCQACAYRYIIHNLRNKSFNITTKKGVTREMPNFENMESFGYTVLQNPLESLIISYPIDTLKQALNDIPKETYSEELDDFIGPKGKEATELQSRVDINEQVGNEQLGNEQVGELTKGGENTSSQSSSEKGIFLDPKELTGGKGLRRMMNFIDEKSPPQKGSFEYKQSTIDKYGRIFSSELIGQFSSKIKCILDHIALPSGEVSEGIILIYSQYIDSGLVPMALALEEMGFTRYGKDVEPLFKRKPTDVVDVRTMKPPKNKKDFMPARYCMITGDPRLSPNNDFEVKGLTNDDKQNGNIQGHKIKVVLISKAGSEGIDLKFIRQVHILEPWYNMNRLDQIFGRAVRNFSHKDLPFEKRNVQIFMYGTLLADSEEEAADLYVYRVAEYKAIQIGRVSRILKETAVDCIINHDQTNFTQEKLNAIIDEEITQELSTGFVINNFKIGDAPYSAACDYMPTCDYNCKPDKKIDEDDLNQDTYNEKFIMTNSEKILQRIRMLMKENFFYKKDVLLNLIKTPKNYPEIQIYAALTYLIENSNETIIDKYDRTGYLTNIGDYYLFQPSELRNKNLSIFDRSVPIDYKHSMVDFQLKQDIIKPVVDMRNIAERVEVINLEGKNIIDDLKTQYDLAVEFTTGPKVPRGDDDWYKHCGIVMKKLLKSGESLEELLGFLVEHILDLLTFKDKVDVMNYLYSLDKPRANSFEWFAKKYFEEHIITEKRIRAIILYDFNVRKTMILNRDNIWELAEPEDEIEIDNSKEGKNKINFIKDNYLNKLIPNGIIGFIGYKKNSKNFIFKTKDVFLPRDTGASCIEAGKSKTLATLNKIVGNEAYTKENTKIIKDEDGNVIQEAIGENELCVLQEFILRKYNKIKKDDKLWFLTPDMAIHYKIYTPTLK
jgi:superfamily II DNA or RNA helicase